MAGERQVRARGVWNDPAAARSIGVREWAWRWLDQHAATLRTSTADSYKGLLETCILDRTVSNKAVGLGYLGLSALTPMRVGEWLAHLQRDGLSASRVRQAYRVLSLAMDAAVRERLLTSNPCGHHHRLPRLPDTEPTILTVADVEKPVPHLCNSAGPRGKDRSGAQPILPNPSLALLVELLAYGGLSRPAPCVADTSTSFARLDVAESLTEVDGKFSFGPTKKHEVERSPSRAVCLPSSAGTWTSGSQAGPMGWCPPAARDNLCTTPACAAASTPPAVASPWAA